MAMAVNLASFILLLVLAALPPTWGKIRIDVSFKVLLAKPSLSENVMKIVGKGRAFYRWDTISAPAMTKGIEGDYEAWTTPIGSYILKPGKKYKYSVQCVDGMTQECKCQGPITRLEIPGSWKSKEYSIVVYWNKGATPRPTRGAKDVCHQGGDKCYVPANPNNYHLNSLSQSQNFTVAVA